MRGLFLNFAVARMFSMQPATLEMVATSPSCSICFEPNTINSVHGKGCTHLFHEECIESWLKHVDNNHNNDCPLCREPLNSVNEYLFHAVEIGDTQTFLANIVKTNPNVRNSSGETILMVAVKHSQIEIITHLLNMSDTELDLQNNNDSALTIAIENNNFNIVKMLCQASAEVNLLDNNDCTPLMKAASKGDSKIVLFLINNGAFLNYVDRYGFTPFIYASMIPNFVIMWMLVGAGINLNLNLMRCIEKGAYCGIVVLIQAGVDINFKDSLGETPLMVACEAFCEDGEENQINLINIFLGMVANINDENNDGDTVLITACTYDNEILVEKILSHPNVDLNYRNKFGNSPLYYAIYHNNIKLILMLLDAGASLTESILRIEIGETKSAILEWAVNKNLVSVVEILLANGFEPNDEILSDADLSDQMASILWGL